MIIIGIDDPEYTRKSSRQGKVGKEYGSIGCSDKWPTLVFLTGAPTEDDLFKTGNTFAVHTKGWWVKEEYKRPKHKRGNVVAESH